jgi:two-component system sensor histidine kinase/response regulator
MNSAQQTILVVEDSQVQAEMLRRSLHAAGYAVEIANNGAIGLEKTRTLRPSAVISDINMPVLDGYGMCTAIRADDSLASMPVILVTTLSDPGYVLRGLQANADAYLTKPYDAATLISWLRNLLARPPVPSVDRRKTDVWIHGETHPVHVGPQRMVNLLVSIYENSLSQNRELIEAQSQLEELNATLETRVDEQTVTIRNSEQRLLALLQHSDGLVLIVDPSGTVTYTGPTVEKTLGYRADEMLGHRLSGFIHPDDKTTLVDVLSALRVPDTKLFGLELRCRSAEGNCIDFDVSAKNLLDDPGVAGYVFNLRDVTLQRRDEAHIRKLSLAVEQSPAMIVIADAQGTIEYANDAYVHTTGYLREELIGKNPRIMQSGKTTPETYREMWRMITKGREWKGEFVNRRKNGEEYTVSATISTIRKADGEVTHFLAVQEDVTEARRIAVELEQYRMHLEEMVASRTCALDEARERAEQANRAKSEFLASMSHEIRTPMNAIIGLAHLLRMKVNSAEQIDMLDNIAKAGGHLLSVINNVLDQAKIEAGKLILIEQNIDISSILMSVVDLLREPAEKNAAQLFIEVGEHFSGLIGDPTRLTQCLINLANNAVRHTVGGSVTLRVSVINNDATRQLLKFEVIDTGIGIEPEVLARLFEPFEQGGSVGVTSPSTGLGLTITRRLAELMGGEAGAESTPLAGSTFWFSAWLRKGDAEHRQPLTNPPQLSADVLRAHAAGVQILLVDDHPLNRVVGRQLLEQAGLVVTEAANGLAAIEAMRGSDECPYALILMDMEMPGMSGIETTRFIREMKCGKRVPIVAMTANAFGEDRLACLAAGMNDHIGKPVEPEILYARISEWLGLKNIPKTFVTGHGAPRLKNSQADNGGAVGQESTTLDLARVTAATGGNEVILRGVLRHFINHHQADQETIERHIATGNSSAAFHIAHAIKGSAGQLGAVVLQTAAKSIELPLRNGRVPSHSDLNAFTLALADVLRQVATWLQDHPETPEVPSADPEAWLEQVHQLAAWLEAVDGNAIGLAENLARCLPVQLDVTDHEAFKSVLETVRRIDLQRAAHELTLLIPRLESVLR